MNKTEFDKTIEYLKNIGFDYSWTKSEITGIIRHYFDFDNSIHVNILENKIFDCGFYAAVWIDKYESIIFNNLDELKPIINKELDKYIKRYENMINKYQFHIERYKSYKTKF